MLLSFSCVNVVFQRAGLVVCWSTRGVTVAERPVESNVDELNQHGSYCEKRTHAVPLSRALCSRVRLDCPRGGESWC